MNPGAALARPSEATQFLLRRSNDERQRGLLPPHGGELLAIAAEVTRRLRRLQRLPGEVVTGGRLGPLLLGVPVLQDGQPLDVLALPMPRPIDARLLLSSVR